MAIKLIETKIHKVLPTGMNPQLKVKVVNGIKKHAKALEYLRTH